MVSQQLRFDGNCARAGYDKIESAWTNGSDRKLDEVQETVAKLSVRSKRLRKNQEETDKKVNQLDTKVEEKVTELKDQIEGLKKSMKTDMDSILQALRQMRPEPEPEA
jgi:hypothetical protein